MSCVIRSFFSFVLLLLPSTVLLAQPAPKSLRLFQLTKKAGYMFSGTVLSVQRVSASKNVAAETVAVTFRVDKGIRGTKTGQTLTIREWAGLWNAGERYRPGEHVFLFLYAPSRLGLTSPVGGDSGRLAIGSGDRVTLPDHMVDEFPIGAKAKRDARQNHTMPLRQFAAAIRRASEE